MNAKGRESLPPYIKILSLAILVGAIGLIIILQKTCFPVKNARELPRAFLGMILYRQGGIEKANEAS